MLYGSYAEGSSITPPAVREAIVATIRSHWGIGSRLLSDIFLGEVSSQEQERFARFQRLAVSADAAARLLEQVYRNDVRDQLPLVKAPTIVVHRREDRAIPYRLDREIAAQMILSPHTVHRHVANIRHKLGRGSRTAAVAEAARLGLL